MLKCCLHGRLNLIIHTQTVASDMQKWRIHMGACNICITLKKLLRKKSIIA